MLKPLKIDRSLADAMRKMQRYQQKSEEAKEEIKPLLPVDPKLPFCVIVDIDRTLAKRSPERGIFEFDKADKDEAIWATQRLLQDLWYNYKNEDKQDTFLILWTGRERKFEDVTRKWLEKNRIDYDQLLMRTTGSFEKADILKENLYVNSIAHKYNVLFVLDDDPTILKLCYKLGLYCLQSDLARG